MKAITAITRDFLPGLIALNNSLGENSPKVKLHCIVYGDDELKTLVQDLGITVHEPMEIGARLPTSHKHPVEKPIYYMRLILPEMFKENILWLDVDQVVLEPLNPLFQMEYKEPCAAVRSVSVQNQIDGLDNSYDWPGLYTGLLHFNYKVWTAEKVKERCYHVMNTSDYVFKHVDQSVLSLVLEGRFHNLEPTWQGFANRKEIIKDAKVLHWHGHSRSPWNYPVRHLKQWSRYYY